VLTGKPRRSIGVEVYEAVAAKIAGGTLILVFESLIGYYCAFRS